MVSVYQLFRDQSLIDGLTFGELCIEGGDARLEREKASTYSQGLTNTTTIG